MKRSKLSSIILDLFKNLNGMEENCMCEKNKKDCKCTNMCEGCGCDGDGDVCCCGNCDNDGDVSCCGGCDKDGDVSCCGGCDKDGDVSCCGGCDGDGDVCRCGGCECYNIDGLGCCANCDNDCDGECKCHSEDYLSNLAQLLEIDSGCCDMENFLGDECEVLLINSLDNILFELDFIKHVLRNEGKCQTCGGYKLFDLNDEQLDLLKLLQLTIPENGRICNCTDEEFVEILDEVEVEVDEEVEVVMPEFAENDVLYVYKNRETVAEEVFNTPVEVIWACADGVEPPTKNEEDLGFDVRAFFEEDELVFDAHETKLVPTGLYAALPPLWGLIAREKGSTGAIGMKCGSGVIDSGYRGEIFIAITNENDGPLVITKDPAVTKVEVKTMYDWDKDQRYNTIYYPYKKGIAQLLVKFNPKVETKVVSIEELQAIPSKRGTGKLGSTDKF